MSAINSFETSLLQHIFQNSDIANIGDATGLRGSTTAGSLYIALLTAITDGEVGTVTEANYTGYSRVSVARSAGGWSVSGNTVSNAAAITFGACTAGSNTIVGFAVYTASSSGTQLINGTLSANLAVSAGITPEFAIGQLSVTLD